MIYFVHIAFTEGIHVQALGFTKAMHCFGWGASPAEAAANVCAYFVGNGIALQGVKSSSPSTNTELRSFTFPEQVYGLPEAELARDVAARGYPAWIEANTLHRAAENRSWVALGHQRSGPQIVKLCQHLEIEEAHDGKP